MEPLPKRIATVPPSGLSYFSNTVMFDSVSDTKKKKKESD